MDTFIDEADSMPNLSSCTLVGKIIKVRKLVGRTFGIAFEAGYARTWPSGDTQEIRLRCHFTGVERVEQVSWLQPGAVARPW